MRSDHHTTRARMIGVAGGVLVGALAAGSVAYAAAPGTPASAPSATAKAPTGAVAHTAKLSHTERAGCAPRSVASSATRSTPTSS